MKLSFVFHSLVIKYLAGKLKLNIFKVKENSTNRLLTNLLDIQITRHSYTLIAFQNAFEESNFEDKI